MTLCVGLLAVLVAGAFLSRLGLVTGTFIGQLNLDGVQSAGSIAIEGESCVKANPSPLVGQPGVLTVRTSSTVGTLTLETGHGVITGQRIDLYWTNDDDTAGKAYGLTVGTVSGNSVPFTTAAGDALPLVSSDIIAGISNDTVFDVVGDNVQGLLLSSSTSSGYVVIVDGGGMLLAAYVTPLVPYYWVYGSGVTNPLAGDTSTKVWFSQRGVSATATDMKATAIVA